MTLLDEAPPAPAEDPAEATPDPAPYGYKADGTPRRRPVSPNLRPFRKGNPGRPAGTGRAGRGRGGPTPPGAPRSRPARPAARGKISYADRLKGLGQLIAAPLAFIPATRMDALAITTHWPAIAVALDETAQDSAELAAVLDRIGKAGPYGAILTAVAPLLAQVAANHGGPLGFLRKCGAVSPQLLLARGMRDGAREAAEAASDAASEEAEIRAIAAELGLDVQEQAA